MKNLKQDEMGLFDIFQINCYKSVIFRTYLLKNLITHI
jgi:hypothetical protein